VALLVPGHGEEEIVKRIKDAGGIVIPSPGGKFLEVSLPCNNTDALEELCELRRLRYLDLSDVKLTDKDLSIVSKLRGVHYLVIDPRAITDNGLCQLESMRDLRRLSLLGPSSITDAGIARLRKALPGCKIYRF
jgi:hypothetical protein